MKKKQYIYPLVETVVISTEHLMQLASGSDKSHAAPQRRVADVF